MGLTGKDKFEQGGETIEGDIKFGSNEGDDFKPFEAGANIIAGYEFKGGFLITANYNTGLNNLAVSNPGDPIEAKYHNRYFGIRIGYMFAGKKN
jgi:hypothetical protein